MPDAVQYCIRGSFLYECQPRNCLRFKSSFQLPFDSEFGGLFISELFPKVHSRRIHIHRLPFCAHLTKIEARSQEIEINKMDTTLYAIIYWQCNLRALLGIHQRYSSILLWQVPSLYIYPLPFYGSHLKMIEVRYCQYIESRYYVDTLQVVMPCIIGRAIILFCQRYSLLKWLRDLFVETSHPYIQLLNIGLSSDAFCRQGSLIVLQGIAFEWLSLCLRAMYTQSSYWVVYSSQRVQSIYWNQGIKYAMSVGHSRLLLVCGAYFTFLHGLGPHWYCDSYISIVRWSNLWIFIKALIIASTELTKLQGIEQVSLIFATRSSMKILIVRHRLVSNLYGYKYYCTRLAIHPKFI